MAFALAIAACEQWNRIKDAGPMPSTFTDGIRHSYGVVVSITDSVVCDD